VSPAAIVVDALYEHLIAGAGPDTDDDRHALAAVIALAACEARDGIGFSSALGLDADSIMALMRLHFSDCQTDCLPPCQAEPPMVADDEHALIRLLEQGSTTCSQIERWWSRIIARRSQRPNHLWQDLGFRHRGDLSALMQRHFRPLARRNATDMKWKRYLYRLICVDGGGMLCTAPTCDACPDFAACFGDESGESLLARNRRNNQRPA
jgi:nitrogen fixation protein NifQ